MRLSLFIIDPELFQEAHFHTVRIDEYVTWQWNRFLFNRSVEFIARFLLLITSHMDEISFQCLINTPFQPLLLCSIEQHSNRKVHESFLKTRKFFFFVLFCNFDLHDRFWPLMSHLFPCLHLIEVCFSILLFLSRATVPEMKCVRMATTNR